MVSKETGEGDRVRGRRPGGQRCSCRPSEQVYEGQIVGEHCRDNDMPVNVDARRS